MGGDQLCLISPQGDEQMLAVGLPEDRHRPHRLSWAPGGHSLAVLSQTSCPGPAEASTFEHSIVVSFCAASGGSMGTATLTAPVRMPSADSLQVHPHLSSAPRCPTL